MGNKRIPYTEIINIVLIAVALAYLVYRLLIFDGYSAFFSHFHHCSLIDYGFLSAALFLFTVNILLESIKWKHLLHNVESISIAEAQRQVYYGFLGAFVTPNRLGEFPTRALLLRNSENFLKSVTLGFVGSFALVFTIEVLGFFSSFYFFTFLLHDVSHKVIVFSVYLVLVVCLVLLLIYFPKIWNAYADKLSAKPKQILGSVVALGYRKFFYICFLCFLRYCVFSLQLYCVLFFCGIHLSFFQAIISIPTYYALVSLMPSIPIADTIFRGSWAVIVFSFFTDNIAALAMTVFIIWVINTVFPMLVGMFIKVITSHHSVHP